VRLGLLGPARDNLVAFARAAEFLLNEAKVTRAIYLGGDHALETMVARWAESLVGPNPSDEGIWDRALGVALDGEPDRIDGFLRSERARLRLRSLESLSTSELRSMEMFGDRVAVLVQDKALLDEEDILSASFLVYGKSDAPLVRQFGARWFLTPGPIGCEGGGAIVLDDSSDEVVATFYGATGQPGRTETLITARVSKLSVRSEPGGRQ
jgi:hypothetical protein